MRLSTRFKRSVLIFLVLVESLFLTRSNAEESTVTPQNLPLVELTTPLKLDATGTQPFWAKSLALAEFRLGTGYDGKPYQSTQCSILRVGEWLLIALDSSENDGIVARESVHNRSFWSDDSVGFELEIEGGSALKVVANPLGALEINVDGKGSYLPLQKGQLYSAVRVLEGKWRVEFAVRLDVLVGANSDAKAPLKMRAVRERMPRTGQIFEKTYLPAEGSLPLQFALTAIGTIAFPIPIETTFFQEFAERTVLEAGRCQTLPIKADDAAWNTMPAAPLYPEDGRPPVEADFQPTEVRTALSPTGLSMRIRCQEDTLGQKNADGKSFGDEDGLEIFIGPERYEFLQFAIDKTGKTSVCAPATGGRSPRKIDNFKECRVEVTQTANAWTVVVNMPLAELVQHTKSINIQLPENYPWRVQVVRNRQARVDLGQPVRTTVLAPTFSATNCCPLRFAKLKLVEVNLTKEIPTPSFKELKLPPSVLDVAHRVEFKPSFALQNWLNARIRIANTLSLEKVEQINDAKAWNEYSTTLRTRLLKALYPATEGVLPTKGPLNARVVFEQKGDGFIYQGVVFESYEGIPLMATLYIPDGTKPPVTEKKRPAIIMIGAHHSPRNGADLQAFGSTFARAGGVALAFDNTGAGERSISALWEHTTYQRNLFGTQAYLAGETPNGWNTFELIRCVDYLLERGDVDAERLAILGGVAGGGDLSAVAAAVDTRITASIPFNFCTDTPFGADHDPLRIVLGAAVNGYTNKWAVNALVAPRNLLMALEFDWSPDYERVLTRHKKVYGLLGVPDRVSSLHGGPNTHATHYAHLHRMPIYRQLNAWWGTHLPEKDGDEYTKTIPHGQLQCRDIPAGRKIVQEFRARYGLSDPNEVLAKLASERLVRIREKSTKTRIQSLEHVFGDTVPETLTPILSQTFQWEGFDGKGVWLPLTGNSVGVGSKPQVTERKDPLWLGLGLAVWMLKPKNKTGEKQPLVLCVSEAGKSRFLSERGSEIKALLDAGICVALLDMRNCGESSPEVITLPENASGQAAISALLLGESMPALRLQDVRTVLTYLAEQKNVDASHVALWGEGFSRPIGPATAPVLFDETQFRQSSPQPKELLQGTGPLVSLVAAFYPIHVKGDNDTLPVAVLIRGGAANYQSSLARRHHSIPMDGFVPNLLSVADVPQMVQSLTEKKVAIFAEDLRDASNRRLDFENLKLSWGNCTPSDYTPLASRKAIESLILVLKQK